MNEQPNDLLLLAGKILTLIMQGALALAALALTLAMPIVVFFRDKINAEILAEHGGSVANFPAFQIAGVMAIVLVVVCLGFLFFGKLRKIIESVGEGDPFAPENADRLSAMGWLMLGIYILGGAAAGVAMTVAEWAREIEDADFAVSTGLDISTILTIVILFILARVFRHGAAMREDLEGTV